MGREVFFFAGGLYARYDKANDRVDAGYLLPIAGNWPGMARIGFANRLDAALNWSDGKVFFFRGAQYARYDVASNEVDAGPSPIARNWPSMEEAGFTDHIDAVIPWGNGKAYFFRGDLYVRYDVASDEVDSGPHPIAGNWPGMAEIGFSNGITAAIDLFAEIHEF
jgi:hypothetical protein